VAAAPTRRAAKPNGVASSRRTSPVSETARRASGKAAEQRTQRQVDTASGWSPSCSAIPIGAAMKAVRKRPSAIWPSRSVFLRPGRGGQDRDAQALGPTRSPIGFR